MGSLSKVQKSLIVGSLLGDGYMRCKTNAHLQITHSIRQKTCVDWKYQLIKEFVITPPKQYQGNGNRVGYRFFTRSLPQFTGFYHQFYPNGKKIIPRDIQITPLTLAVWFMDDGSRSHKSWYLNTQQFSINDQKFLVNVLQKKFGLNAKMDKDKKYFRLRFPVEDTKSFKKIINNLVIPFFEYKLLI